MELKVQKLSKYARLPSKANPDDAGWDLYASEEVIIEPSQRVLIGTDIAMAIPVGYVGLIWDRSGMATKRGIHRFAGVIDSGYRGEVKVCLWNASDEHCIINKGERMAQLLVQPAPALPLIEVQSLDFTQRGGGGFGSSGK
jgi:dUTP pyrophosphatase